MSKLQIIVAQLNLTPARLSENAKAITKVIAENSNTCDLIVFSELAIMGYPPNDLLFRKGIIQRQNAHLEAIRAATSGKRAAVVIGAVTHNTSGTGKPFYNSALVFKDGRTIYQYNKQLLPTYDVFDEARYFEAGDSVGAFTINGVKVGVLICEDVWNDEASTTKPLYPSNPVQKIAGLCDILVSLNASPSVFGKLAIRREMYSQIAKRYGIAVVYVNQVCGVDDLVFDGGSFVMSEDGVGPTLPQFQEGVMGAEWDHEARFFLDAQVLTLARDGDRCEFLLNQIGFGLAEYIKKNGFKRVVVGSSGGLDSALVLAIAKTYLPRFTEGSIEVTAITMPSEFSSEGSVKHSKKLCENLDIPLITRPIKDDVALDIAAFEEAFGKPPSRLTVENIQSRHRGRVLMQFSNEFGALVLNTGNKSEMSVGYFTIHGGDSVGGICILGDVYKTEAYELARHINHRWGDMIPLEILIKPPSAELWEDQKDEESLPPYEVLDAFLKLYIEGDLLNLKSKQFNHTMISRLTVAEIQELCRKVDGAEYKRRMSPPIIKVGRRAFGFGRNIPITHGDQPDMVDIFSL